MGLYLLIPLSVLLVFIIGIIFWWSVRSGQYDDLEGPAYRMLLDDKDVKSSEDETHAKAGNQTNLNTESAAVERKNVE
jgi:cbb3-type cytochrome oxidase maturation protein